jgi:hypothetical protein
VLAEMNGVRTPPSFMDNVQDSGCAFAWRSSAAVLVVVCPTGEKSQQSQTYRGKNVQSVGSLLINSQATTQALRASIFVTEFCVPARRHRPLDNVQILVVTGLMGLALLFFVARLAG